MDCLKAGLELGELAGIRTQDPRIKSALLYQLSYELVHAHQCFMAFVVN
jgi:hypothetical protein